MKNKGFTLSELLAVIAILSILILVASVSIVTIVNNSKNKTNEETLKNLKDAAETFALEKAFIPSSCAIDYTIDDSKSYSKSGCEMITLNDLNNLDSSLPSTKLLGAIKLKVQSLINNQYFSDTAGVVKSDGYVIIYKYVTSNGNYEIKSFASSNLLAK